MPPRRVCVVFLSQHLSFLPQLSGLYLLPTLLIQQLPLGAFKQFFLFLELLPFLFKLQLQIFFIDRLLFLLQFFNSQQFWILPQEPFAFIMLIYHTCLQVSIVRFQLWILKFRYLFSKIQLLRLYHHKLIIFVS